MNIPALPTDSLYKFKALAGLGVAIFVGVFVFSQVSNVNRRIDAISEEIAALEAEIETWEQHHAGPQTGRGNVEIVPQETALPGIVVLAKQKAVLSEKLRSAKRAAIELTVLLIGGGIAIVVGIRMARQGFREWYSFVQVHQDRILEAQARLLAARADKPNERVHAATVEERPKLRESRGEWESDGRGGPMGGTR